MEEDIESASVLEIKDLKVAHEQYDDFVDIHRPVLSISEFKEQQKLPLNEKCASVFMQKQLI